MVLLGTNACLQLSYDLCHCWRAKYSPNIHGCHMYLRELTLNVTIRCSMLVLCHEFVATSLAASSLLAAQRTCALFMLHLDHRNAAVYVAATAVPPSRKNTLVFL